MAHDSSVEKGIRSRSAGDQPLFQVGSAGGSGAVMAVASSGETPNGYGAVETPGLDGSDASGGVPSNTLPRRAIVNAIRTVGPWAIPAGGIAPGIP
jgi:hypothetical protein